MAALPKYFYFRVKSINKGTGMLLEDASDADVVEVVRCQDCIYGEIDCDGFPDVPAYFYCKLGGTRCGWNPALHYCSYGRRRLNHDRSGQGASGTPEGDPDAEV